MEVDLPSPSVSSLRAAWGELQQCFRLKAFQLGKFLPRDHVSQEEDRQQVDLSANTLELLRVQPGLADRVCRMVQADLDERLRQEVAPAFWVSLRAAADRGDPPHRCFGSAVLRLHEAAAAHEVTVRRLQRLSEECGAPCGAFGQSSYAELFLLMLRATLHSQLPEDEILEKTSEAFYERAFQVSQVSTPQCFMPELY